MRTDRVRCGRQRRISAALGLAVIGAVAPTVTVAPAARAAAVAGPGVTARAVTAGDDGRSGAGGRSGGQAPLRSVSGAVVPEEYIVVLRSTAAVTGGATAAGRARSRGVGVRWEYRSSVRGFSARLDARQLDAVRRDPDVAYVQPDSQVRVAAAVPSWGLDRIDQRRGWPRDGRYVPGATGAAVTAYIVDTGMRSTHREFTGRVGAGFSTVADGNGTGDCNGHGTHVAGTVGGSTFGVATQVRLVPVRVLGCDGTGTDASVIAGIDWVTRNHAPRSVANLSLGGSASPAMDAAVEASIASGVTYVLAAGNEAADACLRSPARVGRAITVGATSKYESRATFSNYGACVDLMAPGEEIVSAGIFSDTESAVLSGTSMAAPHVTGVAALYLQRATATDPASVTRALITTATPGSLDEQPWKPTPNLMVYAPLTVPAGGQGGWPPTCAVPGATSVSGVVPGRQAAYAPSAAGFRVTTEGLVVGCLVGTVGWGQDLDMVVQRLDGSTWTYLTFDGLLFTSTETIGMWLPPGTYRWVVFASSSDRATYTVTTVFPTPATS